MAVRSNHGLQFTAFPGQSLRAGILCFSSLWVSCAVESDPRLSSILITLDTTRADALPCYGNAQGRMPHLDAFAAESLTYDFAHTVAPLTLPSHASMLTGLYPVRHSVRINGPHPLPKAAQTLAEIAVAGGIQTAAFVSASVLNAPMGLSQGFEHFGGVLGERPQGNRELERDAGAVVDEALGWLANRDRSLPFFAWLHFFDPHTPFEPNQEFRGSTENAYLDELAYVDHQLGRFLDQLRATNILDQCLIMICADHGEGFGEHDEDSHGWLTYEGVLRVPMLMRYPDGYRAGERSAEVVSLVDVAPTLAQAMELSLGAGIDGISLYRSETPEQRGIYFESYQGYEAQRWSPINGWLDHSGKYIFSSEPEWYDPRIDRQEKYNLVAGVDTTHYEEAILRLAKLPRLKASEEQVDAEQMQAIQALGYAGSIQADVERPDLLVHTGLPVPARMIKNERLLRQAMLLHSQRKFDEARPLLLGILERNPDNPVAAEVLGYGYNSSGHYAEAEQVLNALVERGVRWPNVLFLLGLAHQKQGQLNSARSFYREALAEDPTWKPAIEALREL